MHIATHAHLSRRAFLKGVGVTLSLPFLEAMLPAFGRAATTAQTPRRLVAMCAGLGFHGPFFFPEGTGRDWGLSPYLEPLKEFKNDLTIFSGLSHPEQAGINGHASGLTWLTAAKRPGLPGFKNSVSLDQLIADKLGPQTRVPYLALSTGGSSLSWTASGVQIPGEQSPAKIFKQLFVTGTPAEVQAQTRSLKRGRSILDTVGGEAKKLSRELGKHDQQKLDEYLTSVRELETRLVQNEAWAQKPKPKVEVPPPNDITDRTDAIGRTRLMNDLIVLALQTDSTRAITFDMGGMNAVPKIEGVSHDWHQLSHHGLDAAKIEELKIIELAEFQAFADFLAKLKSTQENGRPLLDNTTVLMGSNLGNASAHDWTNLPILVAGGGFKHGQHLAFDKKKNSPLCNLFVQLAQRIGVETESFGSSTKAGVQGFEAA